MNRLSCHPKMSLKLSQAFLRSRLEGELWSTVYEGLVPPAGSSRHSWIPAAGKDMGGRYHANG
jgi:hypothetical protein